MCFLSLFSDRIAVSNMQYILAISCSPLTTPGLFVLEGTDKLSRNDRVDALLFQMSVLVIVQ